MLSKKELFNSCRRPSLRPSAEYGREGGESRSLRFSKRRGRAYESLRQRCW